MINIPQLPSIPGYVEVEVDGVRQYKNVRTGELKCYEGALLNPESPPEETQPNVWDEMATAYKEGVQEA